MWWQGICLLLQYAHECATTLCMAMCHLGICIVIVWLTGLLELLGPLEAGRVADVFFGTWQCCFLDWQGMFGQVAIGW